MSFDCTERSAMAGTSRSSLAVLMRTAQLGSSHSAGALNTLMTELHAIVWHFLRPRLSGWRDARDVTNDCAQETLVRLFLGYQQCRAESDHAVIAWACTTARHALQDLLRSPESGILASQFAATIAYAGADSERDAPNRRAIDLLGMSWEVASGKRPEEYPARETLLALAMDAYNAAAADTGEMLWWRLIIGAEWSDVAEHLGTTQAGAKRRFQRAQVALRQAVLHQIKALPDGTREPVLALVHRYWVPEVAEADTDLTAPTLPSIKCARAGGRTSTLPKTLTALGRRRRLASVA